ncbi:two-component system response regulator BtsR [Rhodocyclus tenuis]|uniref:Two-component system response regulator BtsR n=1 Tax=Rhodocyclus gracilis TaxID=2929842 RepID=A0ABX0WKN8_9RHOO|nr:two-component system response regulator BtsR [Rhodocyclus gracilis]MRD72760.1 two-component system response regulator BtsR [Rhodocyclus gracilis]NJA90174.1 two-component system response regulator BtsR [Rhodocyclus gracilis]
MDVLIIDDEQPAREEICHLLTQEADLRVVGECANAIEGISAINRHKPDVVFLDIQMPRISGLEMLSMLDPETLPRIVFLTAFDEYAVQAFDQDAFDYLLKPIDPARLDVTLRRLRRDRSPEQASALFQAAAPLKQIPCPGHLRVLLIKVDDVEFATSKASGVHITTHTGSEHFTELSLRTLEEKTPFLRCHRQYLVNPEHIREIAFQEGGGAEIITRSEHHLPVSRRLLPELKEKLGFA